MKMLCWFNGDIALWVYTSLRHRRTKVQVDLMDEQWPLPTSVQSVGVVNDVLITTTWIKDQTASLETKTHNSKTEIKTMTVACMTTIETTKIVLRDHIPVQHLLTFWHLTHIGLFLKNTAIALVLVVECTPGSKEGKWFDRKIVGCTGPRIFGSGSQPDPVILDPAEFGPDPETLKIVTRSKL